MKANSFRALGLSSKLSQLCALLSLVTLVIYCIYGAMYDYFDLVVFLALALGVACAQSYVLYRGFGRGCLNLISVVCLSFGVGLFFLNSYPVWADRLNNIQMYGSRGTLVPVVAMMVLVFLCAIVEIISCFTLDGKDVGK